MVWCGVVWCGVVWWSLVFVSGLGVLCGSLSFSGREVNESGELTRSDA